MTVFFSLHTYFVVFYHSEKVLLTAIPQIICWMAGHILVGTSKQTHAPTFIFSVLLHIEYLKLGHK